MIANRAPPTYVESRSFNPPRSASFDFFIGNLASNASKTYNKKYDIFDFHYNKELIRERLELNYLE